MIMAGGDIAPVEPAVVVPVTAPVVAPEAKVAPVVAACGAGWKYASQAVAYYQTRDNWGQGDLFEDGDIADEGKSQADLGLSIKATNANVFGGIGFGTKGIVLGTGDLHSAGIVSGVMETPSAGNLTGAALTEAYLTYGIGNTNLKVGRQELPLALSPFAYSEGWNVFTNTFEAALLVNTDLPQTTLVGAWVRGNNKFSDMSDFVKMNNNDGVYMLTAQNKSIDGLTLTGSYYNAPSYGVDNVQISWLDAKYSLMGYNLELQGGKLFTGTNNVDTEAYGGKIGTTFGAFDVSLAGSKVTDGFGVKEFGAGVKTPLYTQMILNQDAIFKDSKTIVARAGMKALGGKFSLEYDYSSLGVDAPNSTFGPNTTPLYKGAGKYQELDAIYTTKLGCVDLFGAYVAESDDRNTGAKDDMQHFIRTWAKYNF